VTLGTLPHFHESSFPHRYTVDRDGDRILNSTQNMVGNK
jgi:hypothetical protein